MPRRPSPAAPVDEAAFRARLFEDFRFFVEQVWIDRRLDRYAPLGDLERDILAFAHKGQRRRGVLAFRGVGKTHLVTASLAVWRLFRDPERKVIIISRSLLEAKKTTKLIREWIEHIPFLQHLRPPPGRRDAAQYFDVAACRENRQPSVFALGIGGQLPGNRAHTIIADDVETKENTKSLASRLDLALGVKEFSNILYPDTSECLDPVELVYVGTYHHEESLYLKLAEEGVDFRSWPVALPSSTEAVLGLAPSLRRQLDQGARAGAPTCPHRFPETELVERRKEGFRHWAMQNMLLCDLAETGRYPLRLSDLMVLDVHRDKAPLSLVYGTHDHNGSTALESIEQDGFNNARLHRPASIDKVWAPYSGPTKGYIDPSGRGDDKTGVSAVSHLNGLLYVKACTGFAAGHSPETMDAICALLRSLNVRELYWEDNWGGGMWGTTFEVRLRAHFTEPGADPQHPTGWRCSFIARHNTGQKELRIIDALEPVSSTHRLVVDTAVAADPEFQRQFSRLTRERDCLEHEDELESLAGAVREWQHALQLDPAKAAERARTRLLDDELRAAGATHRLTNRDARWFSHN